MNEQEYHEALSRTHIESGPNWNSRYLTALEANGLKLVPLPEQITGYYIQAPLPAPYDSSGYWDESLIVPYHDQPTQLPAVE